MGPLPVLAAALAVLPVSASPVAVSSAPCPQQWSEGLHQRVWEVAKDSWDKLCEQHKDGPKALAAAKAAFVEKCLEGALPSIQAGYYHAGDAKKLCEEGVPGRDKIYKEKPVPRPDGARRVRGQIQAAAQAGADMSKTVGGVLAGGEPGKLYGERGAGGAAFVRAAAAGGVPGAVAGLITDWVNPLFRPQTKPPLLLDPQAQRRLDVAMVQSRVVAEGVSPEAAKRAQAVLGEMLAEADPAVLRNLAERKVHTYIIPKDKKMTDLEPFAGLRGKRTFDGRLWDNVRGSGNTALPDGKGYAIAVAEESLLVDKKPGQGYPRNFVLIHEFGHIVQIHGLPTADEEGPGPRRGLFERLGTGWTAFAAAAKDARDLRTAERAVTLGRLAFEAAPKPASFRETFQEYRRTMGREGKSTLGDYADANEKEFFAELTAAYFDVGFESGKYNDLRRLIRSRPELAQMMYRVYGPAPSARGK